MKAPAMAPPAAPTTARSRTDKFFIRDCILGLFLEAGLNQLGDLGVKTCASEDDKDNEENERGGM